MDDTYIDETIRQVLTAYDIGTGAVHCAPFGYGHINRTYLITTEDQRRYILQRVSEQMTHNIPALMNNIQRVTDHLAHSPAMAGKVLTLVRTQSGQSYCRDESGYWRIYEYVENTVCLQSARSAEDFYQSALSFGAFEEALKDFPANELFEVIPHFHDTKKRYGDFCRVLEADPCGRADRARPEIAFVQERADGMGKLEELRLSGALPTRVTHNDTKLNNILFDADSHKAVCVIDLDTVMPGLSLYDYGDAIRFGASTAAEDETDLSKVSMDLDLFRAFTKGFLTACPGLTDLERQLLPEGARMMTLECGMRFLTDYLDGDHYFGISREQHNLDRARTQLKLVADMEAKADAMHAIVEEESRNAQQ